MKRNTDNNKNDTKCKCSQPEHKFKIIFGTEYWKCFNCRKEWTQKHKPRK